MTAAAVLPVCDGCGRARVDGRRRHGVEGGRWCQRCYQRARVFTCLGCGDDKRIATAARDESQLPMRCADCVAGDEDLDRFIAIACHIADTEPDLPAGSSVTPLDDQQRWALARRLLHDDTLDAADRVVGSLIVLYAQPVTRIARLTLEDVHAQAPHLTISFGKDHVQIPEPLAGLLRQLPWRRQIGPSGTVPAADRWLFPGRQVGRHIHPDHLRRRMTALGVPPRAARHAAMLQLAREVPAAVLADILGIDVGTATAWTARAGGTWHRYAAQRVRESDT